MADRKSPVIVGQHKSTERSAARWDIKLPVWTVRVAIAALAAAVSALGLFSFSFGQGPVWGGRSPGGLTLTVAVGFALASLAAIRPALGQDNRFKACTALAIIFLTLKDVDSFDTLVRSLVAILIMLLVIATTAAAIRWHRGRERKPKRLAAPMVGVAALLLVLTLPLISMVIEAAPALAQSGRDSAETCPLLDDVAVLLGDDEIRFDGPRREIVIEEGASLDVRLRHDGGTTEHVAVHISLLATRWIPLWFALPELVYTGEVLPGEINAPATFEVRRGGPFNLQELAVTKDGERIASGTVQAFAGVGTFEITAIGSRGERCSRQVDLRLLSPGWQTPDSLVSVGMALLGSGVLAGLSISAPSTRPTPIPPIGPPPRIAKVTVGPKATAQSYEPGETVPVGENTRLEIEFKPLGEDDEEIERHLEADGAVRLSEAGLLIRRQFSMAATTSGTPLLVGFVGVDTSIQDGTTTMRLQVLDQEILVSAAGPDELLDLTNQPDRSRAER